jgi:uncharacterized flavoprotein (TIGR03862 family)
MKSVSIIGGGAASFITADLLSQKFNVTIYEKGKSIGRKFLVAGKGGFNLTHNLPNEELTPKYTPYEFLEASIMNFGVAELRQWYADLGIQTFVGTSNRVFPEKGITPADVLRKIKDKLQIQNVKIQLEHEFIGFTENKDPLIKSKEGTQEIKSDIVIFSLGGGSWKVTGANSDWLSYFTEIGITTTPFQPSNCGLNVNWPISIKDFHIGKPLKNISVKHQNADIKGEALITNYGIEGNAIYPISAMVRDSFTDGLNTDIFIDFKPNQSESELLQKIKNTKPSNYGKALKLNSVAIALTKSNLNKEEFLNPYIFIQTIKNTPIQVDSLRPVGEAISTVGGISTSELNPDFSLKKLPNTYCIGEMLDWDAPTGGFLLQGCFSMGVHSATSILDQKKAD